MKNLDIVPRRGWVCLSTLLWMAACEKPVVVGTLAGSNDSGVVRDADGPSVVNGPGDTLATVASNESWTGFVYSYHFPSGSDAVKISFALDSRGDVSGTVTMGAGTPPPPATDFNVGYPPGFGSDLTGQLSQFSEGYPHEMHSIDYSVGNLPGSRRLQFLTKDSDLWRHWCERQTPVGHTGTCAASGEAVPTGDGHSCIYNQSPGDADAGVDPITVDCGKLFLCRYMCECNTVTCWVPGNRGWEAKFDFAFHDGIASGRAENAPWGGSKIELTKDP